MKGDFSKPAAITAANDLGVLYQQGRVISDRDLTEAELIAQAWREQAARDVIGAGVAAVPALAPDGYMVDAAAVDGDHVNVRLLPGRVWADGIHLTLEEGKAGPPTFEAHYLAPPANPSGTGTGGITDGVRDAVILEVTVGALNGFQEPDRLIEPALGGPDTAERMIPRQRLYLARLEGEETCHTIRDRINDDLSTHGRLSVRLEPPTAIAGDCPVVEGGGYSGFEHNLYRIEIAETDDASVMFKWSNQNGGPVGRGRFIAGADPIVQITANRAAILNSGITEYYLEAIIFDSDLGDYRVAYGTTATLNADGDIDLNTPATFGTMPGAGDTVFFRLWNGIEPIADYTGGATPWRDGIELDFSSAPGTYMAEDYWTFDLRAGDIQNRETFYFNAPPVGPDRRRVPLAEITWSALGDTLQGGTIEDCRRRFRPLTNQKVCCTYLVGNGVTTFGDFNSLEEAVSHLPPSGGQICLLPGLHMANLTLINRRNIKIHGCHERTMVLPRMETPAQPIIRIDGGAEIEIADIDFFAPFGVAIDATGNRGAALRGLDIHGCRVLALTYGFRINWAVQASIKHNRVWLLDHIDAHSAITIRATNSVLEGNTLGVWPFEFKPPIPGDDQDDDTPPDPADPCIEPEDLYGNLTLVVGYILNAWLTIITTAPVQPYRARGGLHLRGACEKVDVIRNRIDGGASHGIVLGGAYPSEMPQADDDDVGEAATVPRLTVTGKGLRGYVRDEANAPVIGLVMQARDMSGNVTETQVSYPADGRFAFEEVFGRHDLEITPGYEVVKLDEDEAGIVTLVVRRVVVPERPDSRFLRQIRIIDNTIERMGLSGIGFLLHSLDPAAPLLPSALTPLAMAQLLSEFIAPRELIGTTNMIQGLEIRGNRIQGNLRIVFTPALRALATKVAQGGISLPLVEGLRITDNHIEANGTSAANPTAGIFVGYAEEMIVSGNYISGNGPLIGDYDTGGIEGLRGGIVVRLATAIISGGATDAIERPALDIRDNHIDQPAGRAITAFAFGPVSCIGNHLNAEREGRWSFIDRFVGAVLLLNLGGFHRHFNSRGFQSFQMDDAGNGVNSKAMSREYGLAAQIPVEPLLPGGEVLFNSNRVRTGGANAAFSATLIGTADDLGFDGNQCTMFKPENVFTNLTAVAHSLRVTDNRFRERSRMTAMSALTYGGGFSKAGKAYAMNATTQNQADHCIIAGSNGVGTSQPVLDSPNQVVRDKGCPVEEKEKTGYTFSALFWVLRQESAADIDLDEAAEETPGSVGKVADQVGAFQGEMLNLKGYEYALVEDGPAAQAAYGDQLVSDIYAKASAAEAVRAQAKLITIKEVDVPTDDTWVIDGRITDAKGRAAPDAVVEVVDARGRPLDIKVAADQSGYYALVLTPEDRARLVEVGDIQLRTTVDGATPVTQPAKSLLEGDAGKARVNIVTDRLADFAVVQPRVIRQPDGVRRFEDVIVARPVTPARPDLREPITPTPDVPEDPNAPVDRPTEPVRPDTDVREPARDVEVPLRDVEGVGRLAEARLREAGINTGNDLVARPIEDLRNIRGVRADALREAALNAMRNARRRNNDGDR